jgi:hypothetical protein
MRQEGDRAAHLAALAAEFGERLELMAEALLSWGCGGGLHNHPSLQPAVLCSAGPASQCHESQGDVPSGAEAHGGREESAQHRRPNCTAAPLGGGGFGSPQRVGRAAV